MATGEAALPKHLGGVCIDIDGTLADSLSHLYRIYTRFLQSYGHTGTRQEFDELNGPTLIQVLQILNDRYQLHLSDEELDKKYHAFMVEEFKKVPDLHPGAKETIAFLRDLGIPLAIVSACTESFAETFLKEHGLLDSFAARITGDQVARGKPFPDLYQKALDALGILPEEALAIEDSTNGVTAATEANITTVWIFPPQYGISQNDPRLLPMNDWWAVRTFLEKQYGHAKGT